MSACNCCTDGPPPGLEPTLEGLPYHAFSHWENSCGYFKRIRTQSFEVVKTHEYTGGFAYISVVPEPVVGDFYIDGFSSVIRSVFECVLVEEINPATGEILYERTGSHESSETLTGSPGFWVPSSPVSRDFESAGVYIALDWVGSNRFWPGVFLPPQYSPEYINFFTSDFTARYNAIKSNALSPVLNEYSRLASRSSSALSTTLSISPFSQSSSVPDASTNGTINRSSTINFTGTYSLEDLVSRRVQIKHQPAAKCYGKVWIRGYDAQPSEDHATYIWTPTNNPCIPNRALPVDHVDNQITSDEIDVEVPCDEEPNIQISRWSNLPDYEPEPDTLHPTTGRAIKPNGWPDPLLGGIAGCTNPAALNYNPEATVDDGTCIIPIYGCTDPEATNYDPLANTDDGSCVYPPEE